MTDEQRIHGVVCASSGNHTQGVAFVAKHLRVDAVIVMPTNCNSVKLESAVSIFEKSDTKLLVQVKKYEGETGDYDVNQLIKLINVDPLNDKGCVISLGDTFSPNAINLAMDNNIALIDGETVC